MTKISYLIILFFFLNLVTLTVGCTNKENIKKEAKTLSEATTKSKAPAVQNVYDFKADSIGFDSPEEVAKQVVEFLQNRDTAKYLNAIIPLEAQKYLFSQNFEYRPDIKDQAKFMKLLESRFERRMNNFLIRSEYITEIMERDKGFQIKNATIDTITIEEVRIKNYGGFNRFIVGKWADVTVKMKFNRQDYFFEIPQIIELKNKWFLYYPEYYIRTKRDLEFIKKRVKEINAKADEFWL
ncbi:hypothetical protein [Aureispira sp. CCB-E]|uniref:hypothetical protein n=1 Tax=Aureispira sp. CCB-E TaxID=3051121 RepID=UPI0028692DB3|nr:hypothetical protein [Aureispira sp. CCB-E]WMX13112.1 hypothetical protein QP953_19920 [Aureispira sp. CCB-E]